MSQSRQEPSAAPLARNIGRSSVSRSKATACTPLARPALVVVGLARWAKRRGGLVEAKSQMRTRPSSVPAHKRPRWASNANCVMGSSAATLSSHRRPVGNTMSPAACTAFQNRTTPSSPPVAAMPLPEAAAAVTAPPWAPATRRVAPLTPSDQNATPPSLPPLTMHRPLRDTQDTPLRTTPPTAGTGLCACGCFAYKHTRSVS
mmetsp:Transcript_10517/g.30537  ORF Transcript_10517/g.30537 Transcript_10517/m.30537 type:complete len:203 (+) Transcript_10517:319-927(+)